MPASFLSPLDSLLREPHSHPDPRLHVSSDKPFL
jgi:hypothetical protein